MSIELMELRHEDFGKAIDFAITGMHFERYAQGRTALRLYGRYFLYLEMGRATQVIAAYEGNHLVGVLMAAMDGEPRRRRSVWQRLYVGLVEFVLKHLVGGASSAYDDANQEMLADFKQRQKPDGELCFLAADPYIQGKGIGSRLLAELERREAGKTIYLFTDSNCTWQFYEHKGFERVGEKDIHMDIANSEVPLTCLLYAKTL